jgi:hypothetical protein
MSLILEIKNYILASYLNEADNVDLHITLCLKHVKYADIEEFKIAVLKGQSRQ